MNGGRDGVGKFFRNKPFAITVIAVIVLVVLLVVTAGGGLSGVSSTLGSIFTPVGSFFSGIVSGVGDFVGGIFGGGSQQQIRELNERVSLLEIENQKLSDAEKENQRLQGLLDYKATIPDQKTVFAKVVFKSPGYMFDVFVINAGYNQGVRKDMAVVNADGLIGRVSGVGGNWSQVTALVDSRSAVSAIVERNRDHGIVRGAVQNGDNCTMNYLPVDSDAVPGDTVVTSGLDAIFPKGVRIGTVTEVSLDENQLQKNAVVDPSVDFNHIEEVLVLLTGPEKSGRTQEGED
jgi:rod shape-determining protein MreC